MSNASTTDNYCFHCGETLPLNGNIFAQLGSEAKAMCCEGCKAVAEYIATAGLTEYYQHRKDLPKKVEPSNLLEKATWQVFDEISLDTICNDKSEVLIDIEGMHCVSCTWLVQNKLQDLEELEVVSLDHQSGIATIRWNPHKNSLSKLLHTINSLGYLPHVLESDAEMRMELSNKHSENSLKRLVVAGLGMMQVMMFAVALYTGNEQNMETVYRRFLIWVSMLVTFPVLFYSGMPFLRHAIQSIKLKRLHMDIPIAIALLAAFSLSVFNSLRGNGEVYFDSVVMFVFFLSISRFIQEKVTRNMLSSRQAFARMLPILVAVEEGGETVQKPVNQIKNGELIAIPMGSVIPTDGIIQSGNSDIDASSLSGESKPIRLMTGNKVYAGMRNLGQPLSVLCTTDMKQSNISLLGQRLLRAKSVSVEDENFITRYVTGFVFFTLCLALAVFIYWFIFNAWEKGFEIALAILVVSCPCALAIAMPSSVASLTKYLHKLGIYVINPSKLFKLTNLSAVILDKTGTLTDTKNILKSSMSKDDEQKYLTYAQALANFTQHPKAKFLHNNVSSIEVTNIQEVKGKGVSGTILGVEYFLGKPSYTCKSENELATDISFGDGQELLLQWQGKENIRSGAKTLIQNLQQNGYEVYISSGDETQAVTTLASSLSVESFYSMQSSEDKLALLQSLQEKNSKVLCIGDGINDAEFLQQADLSISFTNASELAQAQADILVTGTDLSKIESLLDSATQLKTIYSQNIAWAVIYNVVMIPLAVLGFIQPWIAALGMSISSLFVVLNSLRLSKAPSIASTSSLKIASAL